MSTSLEQKVVGRRALCQFVLFAVYSEKQEFYSEGQLHQEMGENLR